MEAPRNLPPREDVSPNRMTACRLTGWRDRGLTLFKTRGPREALVRVQCWLRNGVAVPHRSPAGGPRHAGRAAASPVEARAVAAADSERAFSAFLLGRGGYLFSWGIPLLESGARNL